MLRGPRSRSIGAQRFGAAESGNKRFVWLGSLRERSDFPQTAVAPTYGLMTFANINVMTAFNLAALKSMTMSKVWALDLFL